MLLNSMAYVLNLFFGGGGGGVVELGFDFPTGSKIDDRSLAKASELCEANFHISAQIFWLKIGIAESSTSGFLCRS